MGGGDYVEKRWWFGLGRGLDGCFFFLLKWVFVFNVFGVFYFKVKK